MPLSENIDTAETESIEIGETSGNVNMFDENKADIENENKILSSSAFNFDTRTVMLNSGVRLQVETHVFQQQKVAKEYLKKNGTQIESWGVFAEGKNDYFNNPVLKEIGASRSKSAAQVVLRFLIQSDVVVIPKSTHKERMEENFNVFDLELSADEMAKVETVYM